MMFVMIMTYYINYVNEILLICLMIVSIVRTSEIVLLVKFNLQAKRFKLMNS